jgi:hypothetical protein
MREFGRFGKTWLKVALGGVWGRIGDVATALGLIVPAISASKPDWWKHVIAALHVSGNEALLWEASVAVGGSILLVRLVLAPFWIVRTERLEAAASREALERSAVEGKQKIDAERAAEQRSTAAEVERLQARVAELEKPAPRITVRWKGDPNEPLGVKNVGPIEAHRVKIGDIEVASEYVEFREVDPVEPGEEKFPEFICRKRGEKVVSPLKATMFSWFLKHVGETETWNVWREAAGLRPVANFLEDTAAFEETLDLGPPKHPLVVTYTDPSGARKFETEYKWWIDKGAETIVLEYVGWRAVP